MDVRAPALAGLAATGVAGPAPTRDPAEARRAAEEFEAMFLSQMLSHVWAGVETDGPFGGGHAEEMYRALLVEEHGKLIARRGGLGIAEVVQRQLLQQQEA